MLNSHFITVTMQLHVHSLLAESGGVEHSLALAVLYYVSPDTEFTLDILQWVPESTALCVKLRLQLHELADMHSFLLGCIVLDMCTVPTYQSGECALDALCPAIAFMEAICCCCSFVA